MKNLLITIKIFLLFTILCGIIYPVFITGIAHVVLPEKANGSLIIKNNKTVGSILIGQQFDSIRYFHSRPSAILYNPLPSGGSNYGLTNLKLKSLVAERKQQFISINQLDSLTTIPSEMLFASASGLDPHVSKEAALLQANRVAKVRNFSHAQKQQLFQCINDQTEGPQFSLLGQERVNVLMLNLMLDTIQ